MSLTRFSLKYKTIVISIVAVALLGGLIQFLTMPRRADPSFTIRVAVVNTPWPGAEAERVEQFVTRPLEEEIKTLGEVDFVRSTTTTGRSVIYVELDKAFPVEAIPQVWDRVRDRIDKVRPTLPQGVMDPVVNDDFADTAVMLLALYEKPALVDPDLAAAEPAARPKAHYTPRQLEVIADRVREKIALVPGVARAELHGVPQEVIYLETSGGNWANLELTLADLENLLQARNIYAGGGSLDTDLSRFAIQPTGAFDALEQIEALVIDRDPSGAPIYLSDLGIDVRRGYEDPPTVFARYGNTEGVTPAVIVSFTMKDGFKVTDLGRDVRQLLDDLQQRDKVIPPDVAVATVFDESVFVEQKIGDFVNNLIQAVLIVIAVAVVLAGLRSALAMTVTALMVYGFVRSRPGGEAQSLLGRLMGKLGIRRKQRNTARQSRTTVADRYEGLIKAVLKAKPLVLGLAVALFVGTLMLPVGSQFFPDDKRDVFYIDVRLPEGASLQTTERTTRQVEDLLRELSYVETAEFTGHRLAEFYSSVGGSGPRFALGVDPQPPASNFAQIVGRTTDPLFAEQYVADIRAAAAKTIPGVRIIPKKLSLGPPVDSPLGVRVYGTGFTEPGFANEAELRRQAERVKAVFTEMDGVWDVHDTWGDPGYQLDVRIDEDRANLAGVTNAAVAKGFNAYYSGHYLTTFREADHRIPVYFRLPPEERGAINDPRSVYVEGEAGKVPIDAVAEVEPHRQTIKIERRKMNRMIEVRARVEPGVLANTKLTEAMPAIMSIGASLPPGMSLEIAGEQEKSQESQGEMGVALGVAVILIVLVLIVQYNSISKPLVVLMTVPMGAIGALFGLWLTGNPLGFMPMLGLVSLAGIVVNSGILYIEFADTLIQEKLEAGEGLAGADEKSCNGLTRQAFHECLAQAGKQRLLPIFLTVSTTVGGLIPLALFGGPLWEGMAYLLIFGLIVATVLTLLILPAIYAAFVEYFGVKMVREVSIPAQAVAQQG